MREAGMKVVTVQSAHWEQDEANTVAAAMLREHPELKAILASNDSMALGAAAAVRQAEQDRPGRRRRLRQHRGGPQLLKEGRVPPPPISTATSSPSTASSTRCRS